MFVKNLSYISGAHISKSKQCCNAKPSGYYLNVTKKILVDFHVCISAP